MILDEIVRFCGIVNVSVLKVWAEGDPWVSPLISELEFSLVLVLYGVVH